MEAFHDARDNQLQYRARITRKDADGSIQVECPARAGQVGCEVVEGSVEAAIETGRPIIENPPPPSHRGRICTQNYLTVPVTVTGKLAQGVPFGSPEWERLNNGRASVEGANSSIKSRHLSGLGRGVHEFTGIAWDNIFLGLSSALHNYRLLNNWADIFDPDIKHILLAKDTDEWNGWDLHNKRTALASAHQVHNRYYSYELITHTCGTVATEQTFRSFDTPNPRTNIDPTTEVFDDQCDKPHCRVVHTWGGLIELVDKHHTQEIELATDSDPSPTQ